jgi:hypothetical protein
MLESEKHRLLCGEHLAKVIEALGYNIHTGFRRFVLEASQIGVPEVLRSLPEGFTMSEKASTVELLSRLIDRDWHRGPESVLRWLEFGCVCEPEPKPSSAQPAKPRRSCESSPDKSSPPPPPRASSAQPAKPRRSANLASSEVAAAKPKQPAGRPARARIQEAQGDAGVARAKPKQPAGGAMGLFRSSEKQAPGRTKDAWNALNAAARESWERLSAKKQDDYRGRWGHGKRSTQRYHHRVQQWQQRRRE